jgi:hypothetical protein
MKIINQENIIATLNFDLNLLDTQRSVNMNAITSKMIKICKYRKLGYDLGALSRQINRNIAATIAVVARVDAIDIALGNITVAACIEYRQCCSRHC